MIIRGQNAVQILSSRVEMVSFKELATRLAVVGKVTYNDFVLTFTEDTHEIAVFPDGRVIVKNTVDESLARRLYTKYIET